LRGCEKLGVFDLSAASVEEPYTRRGKMKKILVAIAVVVAVVIAVIVVWSVLLSSGNAEPRSVEGSWSYEIIEANPQGMGGLTIVAGTSEGTWAGPFEGTSTSVTKVEVDASSAASFEETVFFEGSVEVETGKRSQGTVEILYAGARQDRQSDWVGTWEIVAGEGDLANLRGGGTFTSQQNSYVVDYSGQIHFDR
jgi:hypothetical protein